MKFTARSMRDEMRLIATAAAIACLPLFAALVSAQDYSPSATTDPAEIDRAVIDFTGAQIGEVGGARMPADRRLRLAACAGPLDLNWHGRGRSSVSVACPGPTNWRIYIATNAPQQEAQAARAVKRGDPITVLVRGRGFSVQQTGEAMENGAVGDWIAIRTERQGDPIRARIERPGLAIIPVG